ncbi:MAG: hypothetical protein J5I90_15770 [Caldilineales bacterium]|nr:hypothetical protein [Caldilineales bacterium]
MKRMNIRLPFLLTLAVLLLILVACAPPVLETPTPAAMPAPEIPTINVEITADGINVPAEVPSGIVAFTLQNSGPEGSFDIARLNEGVTTDQLNEALASGDDLAALALVSLNGGASGNVDNKVIYDLAPGSYVAVSFPNAGPPIVVQPFTSGEDSGAAAPTADITVQLVDFQFALPNEIKAGQNVWQIENKGGQWHEMGILKLNEGSTVDDLIAWIESQSSDTPSGPPPFEDVAFWSPMAVGNTAWVTWDIPAGEYTVICFLPDLVGDGSPHFAHGMVRTLTVTE